MKTCAMKKKPRQRAARIQSSVALFFFVVVASLSGCAHSPAKPESPARSHSLHVQGDFATYTYTGTHVGETVKVHYNVERVDQLLVRFQVEAERDGEKRSWVQELVDTPANRDTNTMKAVYVKREGQWKQLPNTDNRDLKVLYEWTLPNGTFRQGGKAFPYSSWTEVGGERFPTRCVDVDGHLGLVPVTMHRCESDDFPWRHLEASIRAQATNELLWGVVLESNGRVEQPTPEQK